MVVLAALEVAQVVQRQPTGRLREVVEVVAAETQQRATAQREELFSLIPPAEQHTQKKVLAGVLAVEQQQF